MPGIAHLIFGLFIVVPIMYIAKDRFNYKIAIIFVLNNWIGPDSYWPYRFIPLEMHAIISFVLWCIPLALFYSYLSRFSFKRKGHFFEIIDDGKREVKWRNAYLLCIAGGISHTLIDSLFHLEQSINIFQDYGFPLQSVLWFGISPIKGLDTLIILGYVSMISVSLLIIYFLGKNLKNILTFLFSTIGLVFLSFFTLGGAVFGNELEISAILFMGIFIFVPLCLLAYVANDLNEHPVKELETPPMAIESNLKLVALISLIICITFIILSIIGIISPDFFLKLFDIGGKAQEILLSFGLLIKSGFQIGETLIILYLNEFTITDILTSLTSASGFTNEFLFMIGIIVLICASIGAIGSIGLFSKKNIFRYFVIFINIMLFFFVFPFAIVLFLCQKDIKEIFIKK